MTEDPAYPWVGAVYLKVTNSHVGTAFAVRHNYMMTAAHVVQPNNTVYHHTELEVRLANGQTVQPSGIWVHSLFGNGGQREQDIAVLTFPPQTFAGRYKISIDPADHTVGTPIEVVGSGNKGYWSAHWVNWLEQVDTKGPVRYGTNVISVIQDGATRPKASLWMDFDAPDPSIPNGYNRLDDPFPATQSECGFGAGDSGGPTLMRKQGVIYAVGVHRTYSVSEGGPPGYGDYGYGSISVDVCLATWMPEVLQHYPDILD